MDLGLCDKVILVSGGAKGIGRGIVEVLAGEGAVPWIIDRDAEHGQELVDKLRQAGRRCGFSRVDLVEPAHCQLAVAACLSETGRIDGLVNNAGVNDGVGLRTGNVERFVDSLRRNLVHYYELTRLALPALEQGKGAIVNIASKVAMTGQGGTSAYAAANGGRNALTREWALELAPLGIRVNAIVVAECWTPMYADWLAALPDPAGERRRIEERIPLGRRMTTVEEIGQLAAFLLSQRASHITGQLIHSDGGYVHLDRRCT